MMESDKQKIQDTTRRDDEAVRALGLTHGLIALRMAQMRDMGLRGLGSQVAARPHFSVAVESTRGELPCPLGHVGMFAKTNTTVVNLNLGKAITYSDLNIHMIEAHGFYELEDSPYRLDPAALASILEPEAAKT
ncbi:MAG: hypothetical protein C0404_01055 [Verrucomicrobia bacterium]|nr:hypothetical protein [Verrucomicrobiota bacterium]